MEWAILDLSPARKLHEHPGGSPVEGWQIYRLGADNFEITLEK